MIHFLGLLIGYSMILVTCARKKNAILRSYRHGFSGFAARLSEAEAQSIAQRPGVASVFPDPVFQLHTTRSWEFLKYQTDVKIDSNPTSDSSTSSNGSDTIIGVIDTGELNLGPSQISYRMVVVTLFSNNNKVELRYLARIREF